MSSRATTIKFTLSREVTWAEREAFSAFVKEFTLGHRWSKLNGTTRVLTIYGGIGEDSRNLAWFVHTLLATEYVNIFIKSIQTINPKVKV